MKLTPEVQVEEVKLLEFTRFCTNKRACYGGMVYTGNKTKASDMVMSYEHRCTTCGYTDYFTEKFPYWETSTGHKIRVRR